MKKVEEAVILKNISIAPDIFDMLIKAPFAAENSAAGQFVEIYTGNGVNLLPRPISICEIDKNAGTLRLVYQVVVKGTEIFSKKNKGDVLRIIAPLGSGYNIKNVNKSIFVGGGIGVPPLLETVKRSIGEKVVILGFRTGTILKDDFEKTGARVLIATDDGSVGFKGNVVDLIKYENITGDIIYSCGPKIMLKFLSEYAESRGIECFVSMEERMACGIGACVGCAIKIKAGDSFSNKKVCKDGPVFNSKEVFWND